MNNGEFSIKHSNFSLENVEISNSLLMNEYYFQISENSHFLLKVNE